MYSKRTGGGGGGTNKKYHNEYKMEKRVKRQTPQTTVKVTARPYMKPGAQYDINSPSSSLRNSMKTRTQNDINRRNQGYSGSGHDPDAGRTRAGQGIHSRSGGHDPDARTGGGTKYGYRKAGSGGHEPMGSNPMRKAGGGPRDDKPSVATLKYDVRRSSTPSRRPDESLPSDRSGKERANHKYIDKVRTKTGKIRYIYDDVEGGGQVNRSANLVRARNKTFDRMNKAAQRANQERVTKAMSDRYNAMNKHEKAMKNPINRASTAIRKSVNAGKSWLRKNFGI